MNDFTNNYQDLSPTRHHQSSQLVEKYQKLYHKDPKSKVFAPLCEGYLQLGLVSEALQMALRGVRLHPQFPGGHIALARVFIKHNELEKALKHLIRAVELSPQNISAHRLMANTYIGLNKHSEAIRALKRILFFNPKHRETQKTIENLENLTWDKVFLSDSFQMVGLAAQLPQSSKTDPSQARVEAKPLVTTSPSRNTSEVRASKWEEDSEYKSREPTFRPNKLREKLGATKTLNKLLTRIKQRQQEL